MIKLNKELTSVSFYTLGCRLNQSETAVIERTFERDGYKIVAFGQPADIVIINTCTVTENGDADTRRLVNKANRINPKTKIALIGCQAQVQKEKLADLPNVRWVIGNEMKMNVAKLIEDYKNDQQVHVIAPAIKRNSFTIPLPGIDTKHTRANIKIQDGCDFFCSFCEIPYARGRARSRVFEDILVESKALVSAGHKELVITGINVGTYDYKGKSFLDVIDALEQVNGLERIRVSSIEPTTIPKKFVDRMNGQTKLCRYLHIPLQSGHNQILQDMKRKYTLEQFNDFVEYAYASVKDICIGTDVIVGFPGETQEHFEHTEEYLRESPIHYFHVFSYSKRYLAKSQHMADEVEVLEIQKRSRILRELSHRKRKVFHRSLIDTDQNVLFEQLKDGYYNGVTDNYVRVFVKSKEDISNQSQKVYLKRLDDLKVYGII